MKQEEKKKVTHGTAVKGYQIKYIKWILFANCKKNPMSFLNMLQGEEKYQKRIIRYLRYFFTNFKDSNLQFLIIISEF